MDRRTWFASLFGGVAVIFGYKTAKSECSLEISREVMSTRYDAFTRLNGAPLMSDYDILTKFMKYPENEAKEMLTRLKLQKLEDLKLQVLAQNPQIMGCPKNA